MPGFYNGSDSSLSVSGDSLGFILQGVDIVRPDTWLSTSSSLTCIGPVATSHIYRNFYPDDWDGDFGFKEEVSKAYTGTATSFYSSISGTESRCYGYTGELLIVSYLRRTGNLSIKNCKPYTIYIALVYNEQTDTASVGSTERYNMSSNTGGVIRTTNMVPLTPTSTLTLTNSGTYNKCISIGANSTLTIACPKPLSGTSVYWITINAFSSGYYTGGLNNAIDIYDKCPKPFYTYTIAALSPDV